jgi:hypothetical protein
VLRTDSGALIACEGFRKRPANAIEFGGFTQHGEHTLPTKLDGVHVRAPRRAALPSVSRDLWLMWTRAELFQLPLEFRKGAGELLAACGMCGGLKLTTQFGIGETQRFSAPQLLGIAVAFRCSAPCPLFFSLIHAFLDAILCVDESFACVSHLHLLVNATDFSTSNRGIARHARC